MVGVDRNLFVRKGGASLKKIGKHCIRARVCTQPFLFLHLALKNVVQTSHPVQFVIKN